MGFVLALLLGETDWLGTGVPVGGAGLMLLVLFRLMLRQFSRTDERVDATTEARLADKDATIVRQDATIQRLVEERDREYRRAEAAEAEVREVKRWNRALKRAMEVAQPPIELPPSGPTGSGNRAIGTGENAPGTE